MAYADPRNPPEEVVQRTVAAWLDMHGILWCHVPNEGDHAVQYRRKMAQLGVRSGVPDILIFDPPPAQPDCSGVALELKRYKGGRLQDTQRWWLDELGDRGWVWVVARGINQAFQALDELGYSDFRGRFRRPYPAKKRGGTRRVKP